MEYPLYCPLCQCLNCVEDLLNVTGALLSHLMLEKEEKVIKIIRCNMVHQIVLTNVYYSHSNIHHSQQADIQILNFEKNTYLIIQNISNIDVNLLCIPVHVIVLFTDKQADK